MPSYAFSEIYSTSQILHWGHDTLLHIQFTYVSVIICSMLFEQGAHSPDKIIKLTTNEIGSIWYPMYCNMKLTKRTIFIALYFAEYCHSLKLSRESTKPKYIFLKTKQVCKLQGHINVVCQRIAVLRQKIYYKKPAKHFSFPYV